MQDIAAGIASSSPYGFTVVGTNVFFIADDSMTGRELWKVPVWINNPPPPPTVNGNGKKWGVLGNVPGNGNPRKPWGRLNRAGGNAWGPEGAPGHIYNGPPSDVPGTVPWLR